MKDLRPKDRVGIIGSGLMGSLCPVVGEVILSVEVKFIVPEESKNEETALRFMSGHFKKIERELHTYQPLRRDCYLETSLKNSYQTNWHCS